MDIGCPLVDDFLCEGATTFEMMMFYFPCDKFLKLVRYFILSPEFVSSQDLIRSGYFS